MSVNSGDEGLASPRKSRKLFYDNMVAWGNIQHMKNAYVGRGRSCAMDTGCLLPTSVLCNRASEVLTDRGVEVLHYAICGQSAKISDDTL